nr:ABC transporter I family member 10, chloroplastic [Tanacetum cinerariifolium]
MLGYSVALAGVGIEASQVDDVVGTEKLFSPPSAGHTCFAGMLLDPLSILVPTMPIIQDVHLTGLHHNSRIWKRNGAYQLVLQLLFGIKVIMNNVGCIILIVIYDVVMPAVEANVAFGLGRFNVTNDETKLRVANCCRHDAFMIFEFFVRHVMLGAYVHEAFILGQTYDWHSLIQTQALLPDQPTIPQTLETWLVSRMKTEKCTTDKSKR